MTYERSVQTRGVEGRLSEGDGRSSHSEGGHSLRHEVYGRIRTVEGAVFLDDLLLDLDEIHGRRNVIGVLRELLDDGLVELVVVSYGWGVEFAFKGT